MTYKTKGTCSKSIDFEVNNNIITSIHFAGGCDGNLKGISRLVVGMNIDDVIERLSGVTCGFKSTSCPDQLAHALVDYKKNNE